MIKQAIFPGKLSTTLFVLILSVVSLSPTHAEDKDVWKVIFDFQMKMAKNGNPSAQEKVGEMYEEGRGVKQDYSQARTWYGKAAKQGHSGAKEKLLGLPGRIEERQNRAKQASIDTEAEKEKQRAQAIQKAREEREAQIQAARIKAAKEKAAREKAAQLQAAKLKAAQNRAKLKQQNIENNTARQTGRKSAATTNRQFEETPTQTTSKSFKASALVNQAPEERRPSQPKKADKTQQDTGFKSDPCKSKAARFMSTCRNR